MICIQCNTNEVTTAYRRLCNPCIKGRQRDRIALTRGVRGSRAWLNEKRMRLKKGAQRRDIPFQLTVSDIERLYTPVLISPTFVCPYCDTPSKQVSVDRINNEIGYQPDNCLLVCTPCNLLKSRFTVKQLINICSYLTK